MSKTARAITIGLISAITVLIIVHLHLSDVISAICAFTIVLIFGLAIEYFGKKR